VRTASPHRLGSQEGSGEVCGCGDASVSVVAELSHREVAVGAEQSSYPSGHVTVINEEAIGSEAADGATASLGHEERLVLGLGETVLALQSRPAGAPQDLRVLPLPPEDRLAISLVATALLRRPARLAQRVASQPPAALEWEVVEGFSSTQSRQTFVAERTGAS